ncbi:MAG: ribosome silencing factor [Gammaproteobacteria bacterium]|nr:MAG: ribosome silencing factor [Gammaproteobacteria bacterium]
MQTEELKTIIVDALEDLKGNDISVIDVKGKTSVTDYMIIASGTSNRHLASLAQNVLTEVKKNGVQPLGSEGGAGSDWILVDLGDIVVHVMLPAAREFYDLERFWRDAPETDVESADQVVAKQLL